MLDVEGTADEGECGDRREGRKSLGDQTVFAVGARNVVQRSCGIVVKGVGANNVRRQSGTGRCDGKEGGKREDCGGELHGEDVIGECTLDGGLMIRCSLVFELLYLELSARTCA